MTAATVHYGPPNGPTATGKGVLDAAMPRRPSGSAAAHPRAVGTDGGVDQQVQPRGGRSPTARDETVSFDLTGLRTTVPR